MKTLEDFQSDVAKKYKLGSKLVTGHLKKYYDEASLEFAKYHVQAALESAAKNSAVMKKYTNTLTLPHIVVDKELIRNAYPLTNIK